MTTDSTASSCVRPYIHRPVLFDLDGTLTDSAPIITRCFADTMKKLSGWDRDPAFYLKYVGPPLPDSFAELIAYGEEPDGENDPARIPDMSELMERYDISDDDVDLYVRTYREFYFERMYDTPFFPGVEGLLRRLHAAGVPMVVATSKRTDAATLLIRHLGIEDVFLKICGSPHAEQGTKADRVAEGLEVFRTAGIDTERAVMVGDRYFDTEGASANGVPTVLVTWGEGTAEEYAQAWKTADTIDELEMVLLS